MAIFSTPTGPGGTPDLASLHRAVVDLQSTVGNIQTQNNTASSYFGVTTTFPVGAQPGSMAARRLPDGSIGVSVAGTNGFGGEVRIANAVASPYLSLQSAAGVPTTTQFPNDGQYGWYLNTSTGQYYWTLNVSGTMRFPCFDSISGMITAAQHGNLAGGALHAGATTGTAGFATAAQITTLTSNNTTLADITSGGAASHTLNSTGFFVNGVAVVGARDTGWSALGAFTPTRDYTAAASAATLGGIANALYTLVSVLKTHGLIGT